MTNWTQNIKDLRIKLEANVGTLKKLEKIGTDEAAADAFWVTECTCEGEELRKIKDELLAMGYKDPKAKCSRPEK